MFRLMPNLTVGRSFQVASAGEVTALEESLPPRSRVLVGLVFSEKYSALSDDCARADAALREAGIPTWPELASLVIPDPDGGPVAWVSYRSSPAFWTPILAIVGGIFLLPILSVLPVWIIDKLFPGTVEAITTVAVLGLMIGVVSFMPKMFKGGR